MAKKTWVYDNIEVNMTGRIAERQLKTGKIDTVYEIAPVNSVDGKWFKWVHIQDLFQIKENQGTY